VQDCLQARCPPKQQYQRTQGSLLTHKNKCMYNDDDDDNNDDINNNNNNNNK